MENRCDYCANGKCGKCVAVNAITQIMMATQLSPWTKRDTSCPCYEATPDMHKTLASMEG